MKEEYFVCALEMLLHVAATIEKYEFLVAMLREEFVELGSIEALFVLQSPVGVVEVYTRRFTTVCVDKMENTRCDFAVERYVATTDQLTRHAGFARAGDAGNTDKLRGHFMTRRFEL